MTCCTVLIGFIAIMAIIAVFNIIAARPFTSEERRAYRHRRKP